MLKLATFLLSVLMQLPVQAVLDPELAHSRRCVTLFQNNEREYGIPRDTLHSISLQETGRPHSMTKDKIPWPWTVNVEGKGHYFDNKYDAVKFVKSELKKGKKSIDVGCMQVNLKAHPNAFKTVEEAFDPKSNIAYSAYFLRSKYEQLGNWHKAIAHYHSATPELGMKYKNNVIKIAKNIDRYKSTFSKKKEYEETPQIFAAKAKLDYKPKKFSRSQNKRYRSDMMVHIPGSNPPRI